MDIEGLGEKMIDQLVDKKLVRDYGDLFYLSRDTLISLERLADKSTNNLIQALENSKQTQLNRFIYALGIRHVGEHLSRLLAGHFGSLKAFMEISEDELTAIREVGPQVARSIRTFFDNPRNIEVIEKILAAGVDIEEKKPLRNRPLAGKTFVLTGRLEGMTRGQAKERIEALGGRTASQISGKVDFLVAGEDPGSKLDKARELKVPALTEKEFVQMLK
jgi:DNA ligase (NAD+)